MALICFTSPIAGWLGHSFFVSWSMFLIGCVIVTWLEWWWLDLGKVRDFWALGYVISCCETGEVPMIIFFFLVASFGLWLLVWLRTDSTWLHSDTDLLRQYTEQQQTPK